MSATSAYAVTAASTPRRSDDSTMGALYRAALGPIGAAHYLPAFERFDLAGRTLPGWNWAAALCTLNWMVFRQLWGAALVYVAALEGIALLGVAVGRYVPHWPLPVLGGLGLALLLAATVIPGLYGDAIAHGEIRKRITKAVSSSATLAQAQTLLERQAATSRRLTWIVAINAGLALLAIALFTFFPSGTAPQGPGPAPAAPATAPPAPAAASAPMAAPSASGPQAPAQAPEERMAGSSSAAAPASSTAASAPPAPVAASAPAPAMSSVAAPGPLVAPPASAPRASAASAAGPAASLPTATAPGRAASTASAARPPATAASSASVAAAAPGAASRPASSATVPRPASSATSAATPRQAASASPPAPAPSQSPGSSAQDAGTATRKLYINVGLFAEPANAQRAHAMLRGAGVAATTQPVTAADGRELIRVRAGPFSTASQANAAAARIRALGLETSAASSQRP
ncbi:SPOR domain-containing protein [Paracidovorax anthurii]|uniref:Cell division protein FtsN n=1 Tax=Paracidovorax anthurii TaxID=78229 RepID=A0A328Z4I5_9BURK|nr:SPOR domain-containing protein [Paracidovorax anthurii]RAR81041.1 cell division protein FtsN [Paracidovorax anthurii]